MSAPRPLMTQINFTHSTLSLVRTNFCIDRKGSSYFFHVVCALCCVPWCSAYLTIAHALLHLSSSFSEIMAPPYKKTGFYPKNQRVS